MLENVIRKNNADMLDVDIPTTEVKIVDGSATLTGGH